MDDAASATLQKLEEFFSSPKFTSALGAFLGEKTPMLEYKPLCEDQPLKNYDVFQQYTALVEKELEEFLATEGLTAKGVFDACVKAQSQDGCWLSCIDYLLASTEYEAFMELAYDHFSMTAYEPDDATAWDGGEDDGEGEAGLPLDGEDAADGEGPVVAAGNGA